MNRIEQALQDIAADLNAYGVASCLVGGLAVSVRTEPRFTRDVDLAVSVANDAAAEELIAHLTSRGYSVLAIVEQASLGRLATVRLSAPGESPEGVIVDLLFASSGIETEIVAQAELVSIFSSFEFPVARLEHLIAMKVLARDPGRRPQDESDLNLLVQNADEVQIRDARVAMELIESRNANRGKDLSEELQSVLNRRDDR